MPTSNLPPQALRKFEKQRRRMLLAENIVTLLSFVRFVSFYDTGKKKDAGLPGCCPKVSPNTYTHTTCEACTAYGTSIHFVLLMSVFEIGDFWGHIK